MQPLLKLALLVTGVTTIGLVGYLVYHQHKKHVAQQGLHARTNQSPTRVVKPVSPTASSSPIVETTTGSSNDAEVAEHHIAHIKNAVTDEPVSTHVENNQTDQPVPQHGAIDRDVELMTPPTESSPLDAVNTISETSTQSLYILDGKRIVVYGLERVPSGDGFLFTDGVQQKIEPGMSPDDIEDVTQLKFLINKRISQIVRNRSAERFFTQNNRVGRFWLKTYTQAELLVNRTTHVLVRIVPIHEMALPELKEVYLFVERHGLITSVPDCTLESEQWLWETEVIYSHLLYALDGLPNATEQELLDMFTAMRSQFLALGRRVMRR